ncbi:HEAT repeat domain-containing protein, partial [Streptomyces sp. MCAF7]
MFDPDIAPSGTLLGLLQRGRGDGTLHALAAPRAESLAALHHCVLHDPRRDWQVENRSLYYA